MCSYDCVCVFARCRLHLAVLWVFIFFEKNNRAVWQPRRPDIKAIKSHLLAGTLPPVNVFIKSYSWNMVGPMAVGDTEL